MDIFVPNTDKCLVGKNCYAYALNLEPFPKSGGGWIAPIGLDVWDWILEGILIESPDGDIVIYTSETSDEPIHMGIAENGMVKSKWRDSDVYLHDEFSTPYGTKTKRYNIANRRNLIEIWEKAADETANNLK